MIDEYDGGSIWKLLDNGKWEIQRTYNAPGLRYFEMPEMPGEIKVEASGSRVAWFPQYHNPNRDELKI